MGYIDREKAIAYVEEQYRLFKDDENKQAIVEGCVEALKFTPLADVVKIPCRCTNCKFAEKHYDIKHLVDNWWYSDGIKKLLYITCKNSNREKLAEDDFCSYGERKT